VPCGLAKNNVGQVCNLSAPSANLRSSYYTTPLKNA
jgi:hypothetical protein